MNSVKTEVRCERCGWERTIWGVSQLDVMVHADDLMSWHRRYDCKRRHKKDG